MRRATAAARPAEMERRMKGTRVEGDTFFLEKVCSRLEVTFFSLFRLSFTSGRGFFSPPGLVTEKGTYF